MKKLLLSLALTVTSSLSFAADKPKNIILMVGDGMGTPYTSAYRYYMDNPDTTKVENTVFDELLVGTASTYAIGTQKDHNLNTYVTDSAASATAYSTGYKTYNQAVALDVNDKPLQTIMEKAKAIGKTTGLVVLSQINHATPASFVAHNTYRYNYNDIADQFYDNRVNGQFVADLMLGGGTDYFIRPDRNIVQQFIDSGYHYSDDLSKLNDIKKLPALGLYSKAGMSYAIDSQQKYRLKTMVEKAISLLENADKGYFLLVEGSLIDWCGHNNDVACAMHEMDDFAKALSYLKHYVESRSDTLLVATADHNTGGFSIGADDIYAWKPQLLKDVNSSLLRTAELIQEGGQVAKMWMENINLPITPKQLTGIATVRQKARAYIREQEKKQPNADAKQKAKIRADGIKIINLYLAEIVNKVTHTGWTSTGHTGGDVQVFAAGNGKTLFHGYQNNIDIGQKLINLIK